MKNLLLILLMTGSAWANWTDFYCDPSSGNNLNAGSTTGSAVYTGVGDSDGTSVFTPSDGSTPASSVNVGDWASVYVTSGATVATFIGKVTTVAAGVNGAITVSTTAKAGSFPANSSGAHTITCKTGGAWKGPNGTVSFPINFATGTLTNSATAVRINMKNNANYAITAAMTEAGNTGPIRYVGYTSTVEDGGFATIDGGTAGASYIMLSFTGKNVDYSHIIFQNNGATGNADGIVATGTEASWQFCVFNNFMGSGISVQAVNYLLHCEAYSCNKANTVSKAGMISNTSGVVMFECMSHHNTTNNASGFETDGGVTSLYCISAFNGCDGWKSTADVSHQMVGCVSYGNASNGFEGVGGGPIGDSMVYNMANCAFISNGLAGVNFNVAGAGYINGQIRNCAFGTGTLTNSGGTYKSLLYGTSTDGSTINGLSVSGTLMLASGANPFNAPSTGDFKIVLPAVKGVGLQSYVQTYAGSTWTGTTGFPDIGAAQATDTNSAGGTVGFGYAQ